MATNTDPIAASRSLGRPRDPKVDRAILQAAVEVMSDVGIRAVTVSAVADRAGVARATVYRRWPTRDALIGGLTRAEVGGGTADMTGDLERDIRAAAEFTARIFSSPLFRGLLPEMVAGVLADPPVMEFDSIAVNRRPFAANYRNNAADQGFDQDLDPHLAFDMFLGAQLIYVLANAAPPPSDYVQQLADRVVVALRTRPRTDEA